jgi:DNA-binding NarL/FixJ family response regulator
LIRIIVVDDYTPWRDFVSLLCKKRPDFEIVAEVSDGCGALGKCEELAPDVVLLDLGLPGLNGMEVLKGLRSGRACSAKVIMVTNEASGEIVREAFRLGAEGYVLKTSAGRDLLPAIDGVLKGENFISSALSKQFPPR